MSNFARDTSLDDLKKIATNLKVQRNDANNTWVACVELPDGHRVHAENRDRFSAIVEAKTLSRDYEANKIEALQDRIKTIAETDKSAFTVSINDPRIAGLGYEIDPNSNYSIAQHASHLEKLMTGLIEKAKREGLDGRLIAMANTDFERGFMALEKAVNTNKG